MKVHDSVEKMLLEYRVNKDRIDFFEKQISHFTSETDSDYIESKMFAQGNSGKILRFAVHNNEEVALLNKVEETAENYSDICESEYINSLRNIYEELSKYKLLTNIVEDSLEIMAKSHKKYKLILEKFYINGESMENVAESLHLSCSRCYGLCKEAVKYMERIVHGE